MPNGFNKLNSSAGIRYFYNSFPETGTSNYVLLAYAYEHSFSEDLQLKGGIAFSHAKTEFEEGIFGESMPLVARTNGTMGLGLALTYGKFYAGFVSQFPLYVTNEIWTGNQQTEKSKEEFRSTTLRLLSGYSLDVLDWLRIDPIFGLDYYILNSGTSKAWRGYLGSNLVFLENLGLGFTVGNVVSVSASVELLDRLSLMLGIYAGEYEFGEGLEIPAYTLGANDFEIIGQIRIRL